MTLELVPPTDPPLLRRLLVCALDIRLCLQHAGVLRHLVEQVTLGQGASLPLGAWRPSLME